MKRRLILAVAAVAAIAGTAVPALADSSESSTDDRHQICLSGSSTPSGPTQGLCVWIPTN